MPEPVIVSRQVGGERYTPLRDVKNFKSVQSWQGRFRLFQYERSLPLPLSSGLSLQGQRYGLVTYLILNLIAEAPRDVNAPSPFRESRRREPHLEGFVIVAEGGRGYCGHGSSLLEKVREKQEQGHLANRSAWPRERPMMRSFPAGSFPGFGGHTESSSSYQQAGIKNGSRQMEVGFQLSHRGVTWVPLRYRRIDVPKGSTREYLARALVNLPERSEFRQSFLMWCKGIKIYRGPECVNVARNEKQKVRGYDADKIRTCEAEAIR
ncbi:uncharacterized protein BDR25DRAFT_359200 [Lindgomyces ingoldianus]|uniref:Uncharacterized protein n=1 Tax=Lindgomyces ingoldianus TaxID=673940 RepID=A0ACB6QI56_9PLEO|nr:uncharacterized protein BDR25DRAFT_359200 [Lindgomyces ingoldianus]KAF2466678.1 hypothetical protein BDR25DRAFT_359200 [Lindgomyces ingoldianus]